MRQVEQAHKIITARRSRLFPIQLQPRDASTYGIGRLPAAFVCAGWPATRDGVSNGQLLQAAKEAVTMVRKLTVGMLVVTLCAMLLHGARSQTDQANQQANEDEAATDAHRAADGRLANGDFELGQLGEQPADWFVPDIPGYRVTTTDQQPAAGNRCATIATTEQAGEAPFGNLLQQVDARPFRGRRVRFRAAVRTEVNGRGNQAQMWLRVDWTSKAGTRQVGAFDNMMNRPITLGDWDHYEIVADVDLEAEHITLGVFLMGEGQAWIDDASLTTVGAEVPTTARRMGGGKPSGRAIDEIEPGLFEVVSATRLVAYTTYVKESPGPSEVGDEPLGLSDPPQQTLLLPLPLSYRDQVPISFELNVQPPEAVEAIDIYEDQPRNFVLKLAVGDVRQWEQVDVTMTATVLVGPSNFDAVPESAPIPDAWPAETEPWLGATWCADANHERFQALAAEIRAETDDVLQIIRRVEQTANKLFRSASGQAEDLTAVAALDHHGSCTSCANLVAALLRACGVPARVLSGYPAWSPPLQTHYIVEAYVPDFGWRPMESTLCRSPWPNTHQVNVAIIPPEYEDRSLADGRCWAAAGVPYLSLTEMPDNTGSVVAVGMVDESRNCDHVCRMVRDLRGSPDEWQQAIAAARSHWGRWLAGDHNLDAEGRLLFGTPSREVSAISVSALAEELELDAVPSTQTEQ